MLLTLVPVESYLLSVNAMKKYLCDQRSDPQSSGVLRDSLKPVAGSISIPSPETIEILKEKTHYVNIKLDYIQNYTI